MLEIDQMTLPALAFGALMAVVSEHDRTRRFVAEHTTETVIIGVGGVLAILALALPRHEWAVVARAFGYAGLPLAVRALLRRLGIVLA